MHKTYLSMLVENKSGVLTRISGLVARRGYNIDSLTVCATEDDKYSRMTLSFIAVDKSINQIKAQLEKQVEVAKIVELHPQDSVLRELLLIKINATTDDLSKVVDIATIYKAKTIDVSGGSITLELTGRDSKLDSFIEMLSPFGIIELARSGVSALRRGKNSLREE